MFVYPIFVNKLEQIELCCVRNFSEILDGNLNFRGCRCVNGQSVAQTDHLPDFGAIYSLVLQFSTQSTYTTIKGKVREKWVTFIYSHR